MLCRLQTQFQFQMVRLKGSEVHTNPAIRIQFQFQMVRLKELKNVPFKSGQAKFQFQMVRLKEPMSVADYTIAPISIPDGSIKREPRDEVHAPKIEFQFQMVRLKAAEPFTLFAPQ